MKPEDFAGTRPCLRLETYFAGHTRGWGIFEDRFGNLRRQFTLDVEGIVEGDRLILLERFAYADGETGSRTWRIQQQGKHGYLAEADDMVGTATGTAYGSAFNWTYRLDLKVGKRIWRVSFDEWMFLQSDDVVINRANVYRFGIRIGSVLIFFRKAESAAALVSAA